MMSASTRATRSRYSSPQQLPNGPLESSKSSANEGPRTFLQRWLEPAVQSKASFEEAGLLRYGVMENMAPLGTLPKAAAAPKKPAQENAPIHRKIIFKQSSANAAAAAAAAAAAEEETAASNAAINGSAPSPTAEKPSRRSLSVRDLEDDDDYNPKASAGRQSSGRASLSRRSLSRPSAARRTSTSVQHATPASDASQPAAPAENKEGIDQVVDYAVEEALRHYRYPTAWALRTLYDENRTNRHFLSMFEEVYTQTADADTLDEFARLIEDKKKEGKKDNLGCYHFVPPTTNARFTPHKAKPAPYSKLLSHNLGKFSEESETPTKKKSSKSRKFRESLMEMDGTGMNGKISTPSRKRVRRASMSSDSSLSELSSSPSLPSPTASSSMDDSFGGRGGDIGGGGGATAPETRTGPNKPPPQPITTRGKSFAANKMSSVSDPSTTTNPNSPSPTFPPDSSTGASMPGRVSSPLFPNLSTIKSAKSAGPAKNASKARTLDDDDASVTRRRIAQRVTNGETRQPESSIRGAAPALMRSKVEDDWDGPQSTPPPVQPRKARTPAPNLRSTRSGKRSFDELEGTLSPTAPSFQGDAASNGYSRAGTPASLHPAKKPRTGLRIKTSPMKKKGGTAAGVPRASGEGNAPTVNGAPTNPDDNDDYCSACGGIGDLVCCDNCSRSFHFECVDLVQCKNLPDEWFCNVCFSSKYPARLEDHKGPFSGLLSSLDKTNPQAFKLPQRVQGYFEGVKAGPEGEYEEVVAANKPPKKKGGYEEAPDFFRTRDADGNAVLCHNCQTSATDNRAIIPCSLCSLYWHLDCLDPPLAIPPPLRTWRCPAHADDLLATLPADLAPAHRFRKIKGAPAITPTFGRGIKNNGYIEIEDESEDETGWSDVKTFGRVYKLPAKGVVLDFISQLRNEGAGHISRPISTRSRIATAEPISTPQSQPFSTRDVEEIQTALNLAELKSSKTNKIEELTQALMMNADPAVLSLMARGSASNFATGELNDGDRQSLRAMLAQMDAMRARIRQVLGNSEQCADDSGSEAPDKSSYAAPELSSQPRKDSCEQRIEEETATPMTDVPTPKSNAADPLESLNGTEEKEFREPKFDTEDSAMDLD